MTTSTPPLVILGIDAGDPDLLVRWAEEGYLPTIASLMERGCWGRTSGAELVCEHGVWTSLMSGMSRGNHGYYYFRQLEPGSYNLKLTTGRDIDAPPFWSHLRGCGKKVAIIDASDVDLVPELDGIQLLNWAVHNPLFPPSTAPAALLDEVRRVFGPQLVIQEQLRASREVDWPLYRQMIGRLEKKGALCRYLLAQDQFDLIVAVFGEPHTGIHQFWKYVSKDRQPDAKEPLSAAIRTLYQATDRQIGLLLEQLPADANVIVLSSVGIVDMYPHMGLMEAFCRKLGYQAAPESSANGRRSLRPLDIARRLVPEPVRVMMSRGLSRDARERLLADQFRTGTDWSKTTVCALPSVYTGFLRVNLRGREPQGIVAPGAEYEALLQRVEDDLRQLVDPHTGEPAIGEITRASALFGDGPPDVLPDLFVDWQPTTRFRERVLHPRAELTQQEPEFLRETDHSHYGFVVAAGPQIGERGEFGELPLLDLAPTFLSLLGESAPLRMSGQVSPAILGAAVNEMMAR
jgi:predicted AlkP superfamily phosphohydrolase/phosphomutase